MAKKKGAMSVSPSAARQQAKAQEGLRRISPGVYQNAKGERVNSRGQPMDSRGRVVKKEAPPAQAAAPAQPAQPAAPTPQQQLEQGIYGGLGQQLGYMAQQGQFQPGDFGSQMQGAYENVMQNFDRSTGQKFAREQADFRQMAAERGLDPNSEAYRSLSQQLNQQQQDARMQAMGEAQKAAQSVQQQGFTQGLQAYQAPATMLGALSPLYGQFGEQQQFGQSLTWEQQKLAQQHRNQMEQLRLQGQLQARMPRGDPNALTYQQRLELMDREMANRAAIQGNQQPQQPDPNLTNEVISGATSGAATQLMS